MTCLSVVFRLFRWTTYDRLSWCVACPRTSRRVDIPRLARLSLARCSCAGSGGRLATVVLAISFGIDVIFSGFLGESLCSVVRFCVRDVRTCVSVECPDKSGLNLLVLHSLTLVPLLLELPEFGDGGYFLELTEYGERLHQYEGMRSSTYKQRRGQPYMMFTTKQHRALALASAAYPCIQLFEHACDEPGTEATHLQPSP